MPSSRPDGPPLLPLCCPACGGSLDPLQEDIIFLCAACGGASELQSATTIRCELRHATPAGLARPVHLPFWRLGAGAVTPAFNGARLLTLTRWFSARATALDALHGGSPPRALWGGRIGSVDARRVFALAVDGPLCAPPRSRPNATHPASLAGGGDVGPREPMRSAPGTPSAPPVAPPDPATPPVLMAIPFLREPSRLVCMLTGLHIYLETLEGAMELLARWDKLDGQA